MHVLVTRPEPDGKRLKVQLAELGVAATLAPTLDLVFEDLDDIDLHSVQAVVITSRNALRSLAQNNLIKNLSAKPVYTVGETTADFARSLGLTSVYAGPGTARALSDVLVENCRPKHGSILHFRGAHIAFDLKSALEMHGFKIAETIVYRADPVSELTQASLQALNDNNVNGVILMSVRSAKSFIRLMEKHNLLNKAADLNYFCLSSTVGDCVQALVPNLRKGSMFVSDRPNTEELLALIGRFAANYRQI